MKFTAINQNSTFVKGYRKGRCFVHGLVVVYVLKNKLGRVRIGITSSKKIGGAVVRNRARRVIREAVRASGLRLDQGYDLIFVARSRTARSKSTRLIAPIRKAFRQAGVACD